MKTINLVSSLMFNNNSIGSRRILIVKNSSIKCYAYCRDRIFNNYIKDDEVVYLFCKSDKKDLIKTISKNFSLYKKQYFKLLKTKVNFHHTNCIVCYKKCSFYGISFSFFYKEFNYYKNKYYFKLPLLIARNAHKTEDNIRNIFKSDKYNFKQEMNVLKPVRKSFVL